MSDELVHDVHHATPCTAPGLDCRNVRHDHYTAGDLDIAGPEGNLLCGDCRAPAHYDGGADEYRHDSSDASPCFLIPGERMSS
jgi:hypothetical protein